METAENSIHRSKEPSTHLLFMPSLLSVSTGDPLNVCITCLLVFIVSGLVLLCSVVVNTTELFPNSSCVCYLCFSEAVLKPSSFQSQYFKPSTFSKFRICGFLISVFTTRKKTIAPYQVSHHVEERKSVRAIGRSLRRPCQIVQQPGGARSIQQSLDRSGTCRPRGRKNIEQGDDS